MADRGRFDENARTSLFAVSNDGNYTPVSLWADPTTHELLVSAAISLDASDIQIGAVEIKDGASDVRQTVFDLTNSNPGSVAIVDASGDQITSFGGGAQYTQGDTDASITGTAMLMEVAADTLQPIQGTVADGLLVNLGTNNDVTVAGVATAANQTTIIGHVDGIEGLLGTIDADTGNISTKIDTLAGAVSGTEMQVDVLTMPTVTVNAHAVTNAGTFAVQESGAALTALQLIDNAVSGAGFNITQINGVNVTMGNGASGTGVQRVTIANDSTGVLATVSTLTGGGIAHDAADSGNPHKIGLKAYSPDGTTPGTAVAELDRTDAKGDLDGRQYVNLEHPRWWSYHSDGSSALTDASVQSAPGAGFQLVITEIIFSTGAATACNIFFEEGATKILGPWYLEAVAGRGVVWRGRKHVTANTALTVTTSAAIAQSVDVQGYIQAV